MSTTRTTDCRKFSPNIFNKSKCSHCFRQREEHSAAALECNRASRKVSKCGYLFVAPDWDFSNPLYRTKRWQRRWFVLYDDGELTYSVDEHPETVPQASIDMTKVIEVATAEDVTGHSNSVAITAPDRVTFVKGTCPEESKWWLNILVAFPKSKGRHKRHATFPGAQTPSSKLQSTNSDASSKVGVPPPTISTPKSLPTTPIAVTARHRHNSFHQDGLTSGVLIGGVGGTRRDHCDDDEDDDGVIRDVAEDEDVENSDDDDEDDGVETGEDEDDDDVTGEQGATERSSSNTAATTNGGGGQDENNRNAGNEITSKVSPPCLLIEDIRHDKKTIKDIENTIKNLSQQQKVGRWSTTAVNNALNSHLHHNESGNVGDNSNNKNSKNSHDETDFSPLSRHRHSNYHNHQQQQQQKGPRQTTTIVNLRPKSLPLASNSTPAIVSAIVKKIPPVMVTKGGGGGGDCNTQATQSSSTSATTGGDSNNNINNNNNNNHNNKNKSSPRLQLQLKQQQQQQTPLNHHHQQQLNHHHHHQHNHHLLLLEAHERGDPDGGCNLDDLSTNYLAKTAELRVVKPSSSAVDSPVDALEQSGGSLLNAKKGWLMKQDNRSGDWTKHWFTLSGAALFFYRDPMSEERGVLDGVLDVNSLTQVSEVSATKSYAFQLTTWDKRRLTLASLSPNSRNSWIAVLRNAAGLSQSCNNAMGSPSATSEIAKKESVTTELIIKDPSSSDDDKTEIEKDFIKAQRITSNSGSNSNNKEQPNDPSPQMLVVNSLTSVSPTGLPPLKGGSNSLISPITPSTPKIGHFSSDEEYRTASEGGRRDSIDWGSPLSPSPPIPLSLLRAKERMSSRGINYPRLHKRSRSSPPSSRRSTVDSVGSDDMPLIQPVQEELNLDKELQFRLSVAEKERNILQEEAKEREARMSELLRTLERTEQELNARIQEMEEVRENLTSQLEDAKRNAEEIVDRLTDELDESQRKVKDLEDRLTRGIDENETLYKRLRELESCSPSGFGNLNRSKLKRLDSLSDLTQISDIDPFHLERDNLAEEYNELRSRFEKAVNEIKAMKRELKESQNQFDSLEISYATLKKDLERKDVEDRSQLNMMAARIQDLTLKYSNSERQVRSLKQKLAKAERRRSLSLKGKEQLSVSKELELKLSELEAKIEEMEKSSVDVKPSSMKSSCSPNSANVNSKKSSSRRRSLESAAHSDSVQFLVRVSDLEKRCDAGSSSPSTSQSTSTPPTVVAASSVATTPKMSEHLFDRLRSLENVLIASKDRLEHSLQQLQSLRSTRTRRSVSPIADRKDSYRYVERSIAEVVKLIRESCDTCVISRSCGNSGASPSIGPTTTAEATSAQLLPETNPVKSSLTQLEAQLRAKLADLLKKRRMLRERNELTKRKDLELLAERVAYESVCFGKLRDSVARAENPELFGERQTRAEVAETSHLMTMLKAKLSGKCAALKANGSVDVLAGVLARRLLLSSYHRKETQQQQQQPPATPRNAMEPVDQNILDDLLRQQNELCVIVKRYKNNAMENLATGLAAETLSYISSNDLVQGAVQEAWRQAQETVNAELVQSEIAHIMMRNAERFESAITPAFGYTLTAAERLSFEKFADAVHDTLRREMEAAVAQLTGCYEQAIQKMKRGQWRMHMEQERKASEGRQLLAEFADIVAHKALVDARIAVLCGDYNDNSSVSETGDLKAKTAGLSALQRYERLFEELSHDLQIDHPDEMLAEADFEFMYKQHTVEFLNDRQVLADISSFLGQLEDSLIALQCEAATVPAGIARSAISIESLEDVCHKCCDLRQRADQLLQDVHRKLNTPCQHCHQVREKLCSLQQQHDSEMMHLQQNHAQDLTALMQQAENQRNALRNLEAEKNAINGDLHRSEELLEERERELAACKAQLRAKESEMRDQHELRQRLDEGEEKCRAAQEESDALTVKCARQDEEYAVLLQERDFLQAELAKEKERSRRFEKRLELLEAEHSKQLECLQEAYRDQMLAHCPEFGGGSQAGDDESFRLRYQTEIEQLRTLCEKGLSAMESSHRRIISDLEEKHREEIERLLLEKETALAEETQATLAALDAMRKAHQSEVQREVARFKQEFLKQVHRGELSHDGTKANEEELEELRLEILSFSEKYSIKCVENAALEEKLRSANQKLKHFQQMQQIELRNKQFRAHLASDDPKSEASFVQGLLPAAKVGEDGLEACEDSESKLHALEETTIKEVAVRNELPQQQQREQQQKQQLEQKVTILHSSSRSAATKTAPTAATAAASSLSSVSPFVSMKAIPNDVEKLVKKPNVARFPTAAVGAADEDLNQVHHDIHRGDEDRKQAHNDPENVDEVVVEANKPVDAHDRHIDDGNDHIGDNKDDDDHDHDDNDNDDDVQRRYSYEPCYKQANLYNSYANRLSFQGLNLKSSSTFGKNLKKARKVVEKSATTTTATTHKSLQQQQYNKATSPASSKVVLPATTATTMLTLTNKSSNSEQKETNATITVRNITTTPTTTMHCITPVEQPKNFSANKHVNYKNINNNHLRPLRHEPSSITTTTPTTNTSNLHNSNLHNNVYFNYLNLKRPPTTNEEATPTKSTSSSNSSRAASSLNTTPPSNDPQQIIKYNNLLKNNNNTNNMNNNNKISMKNMKISEKSAINLESFTQIIHNTPVASGKSSSRNRRRLNAATTLPSINQDDDCGGSDDDDVGGDENVVEGDDCDDNGDVHDNVVVDTNKTTVVANDINTTNNNNNTTHNEDINGDFVKKQLKRNMPDDGGCNRRAGESTHSDQASARHEQQRRQYCSPPPLNGRDVEHSRFKLTATATTESANTTTTTKPTTNQTITDNKTSATITTPKTTNLKKFELEI